MPEFEQRKRRSLSDQELYDEYYGISKKKASGPPKKRSKSKKGGNKTASKPPAKRDSVPVSAERQRLRRENNIPVRPQRPQSSSTKASKSKKNAASNNSSKSTSTRKKHGSYILYYILCGIIMVSVVVLLSATVLFNISSFEITGETRYSDEDIIAACGISEGENLLRISIEEAEANIVSKLVYIDTAEISRGFPNKLNISVTPARVNACYAVSGKYYLVSEIGRLLEVADNTADCPLVKGYIQDPENEPVIGEALPEDEEKRVSIAAQIIGYMDETELKEDYEIDLSDTLNIRISYDDRIEINLGTSAELDAKIQNAGYLVKYEVASNERCTLSLINAYELVKKPIYDEPPQDGGLVVTESTEEPENTEESAEDTAEESPE